MDRGPQTRRTTAAENVEVRTHGTTHEIESDVSTRSYSGTRTMSTGPDMAFSSAPLTRDRVRWGPIWAGLFTAITTLLILGVLGLALGFTAAQAAADPGGAAPPDNTGTLAAIYSAVAALLSFFIGGVVASKTSAVLEKGWGGFNGAMVFLTAVPLLLLMAGLGLSGILGTLGSLVSGVNVDPGAVQGTAQQITGQAQGAAQQVTPQQAANAAEAARNGALGTLAGLLLGLIAAIVGGVIGTRSSVDTDNRSEHRI